LSTLYTIVNVGHSTSNQHSHPTRPSPILLKIGILIHTDKET